MGLSEKDVHQGVQAGGGPAAGARGIHGRGSSRSGIEPEIAAPLAPASSARGRAARFRATEAALVRRPDRRGGNTEEESGASAEADGGRCRLLLASQRRSAAGSGVAYVSIPNRSTRVPSGRNGKSGGG